MDRAGAFFIGSIFGILGMGIGLSLTLRNWSEEAKEAGVGHWVLDERDEKVWEWIKPEETKDAD